MFGLRRSQVTVVATVAALTGVLLLGGCGGDDGDSSKEQPPPGVSEVGPFDEFDDVCSSTDPRAEECQAYMEEACGPNGTRIDDMVGPPNYAKPRPFCKAANELLREYGVEAQKANRQEAKREAARQEEAKGLAPGMIRWAGFGDSDVSAGGDIEIVFYWDGNRDGSLMRFQARVVTTAQCLNPGTTSLNEAVLKLPSTTMPVVDGRIEFSDPELEIKGNFDTDTHIEGTWKLKAGANKSIEGDCLGDWGGGPND